MNKASPSTRPTRCHRITRPTRYYWAQGLQGHRCTGEQGVTGAQGLRGETGAKGDKCDQGEQGITGAQGETLWKGLWSNTKTYTEGEQVLWDGKTWQFICPLTGPCNQGEPGTASEWLSMQGITGLQGAQGLQGEQGVTGVTGAQGERGEQGVTGAQGEQGVTGARGEQGQQGVTGAQGEQGVTGAQGLQGVTGARSEQGVTGVQGVTGAKGDKGDSVWKGLWSNSYNYVEGDQVYWNTESYQFVCPLTGSCDQENLAL